MCVLYVRQILYFAVCFFVAFIVLLGIRKLYSNECYNYFHYIPGSINVCHCIYGMYVCMYFVCLLKYDTRFLCILKFVVFIHCTHF